MNNLTTSPLERAERLQVKLFVDGHAPEATALIPVFHRWIREGRLADQILIDVADYSHVYRGPGVLLVGHGVHWAYDHADGRPGILFNRQRGFDGSLRARITDAFEQAWAACHLLESELGLKFSRQEALVRITDRLVAKNDATGFAGAVEILREVAPRFLGEALDFSRVGEPNEALAVGISNLKTNSNETHKLLNQR